MLKKEELENLMKKSTQLYNIRDNACGSLEKKMSIINQKWNEKDRLYKQSESSAILNLKRQTQLEEYTYNRIKLESDIKSLGMFFEGVDWFKKYIESMMNENEIDSHKYAHLYAQSIREQAIYYCESQIKQLKQKNSCRTVTNRFLEKLEGVHEKDPIQYGKTNTTFYQDFHVDRVEEWKNIYAQLTTAFQDPFVIDPELLKNPTNYLDFKVLSVVKNLYPSYKKMVEEEQSKTKK